MTQVRDAEIRSAARARLLAHARACPDTLVVDELGVQHGSCRIDIAVISAQLRAIEIKAETDTLSRLERQVVAYGLVADRATLIASECHVPQALQRLPEWWGIICARRARCGGIVFRRLRPERVNSNVDPIALARLLWRDEAISILARCGYSARDLRAPRRVLYEHLASAMPVRALGTVVRATLKSRKNWRDRRQPSSDDGLCQPSAML
jgi:hypothetical protein